MLNLHYISIILSEGVPPKCVYIYREIGLQELMLSSWQRPKHRLLPKPKYKIYVYATLRSISVMISQAIFLNYLIYFYARLNAGHIKFKGQHDLFEELLKEIKL